MLTIELPQSTMLSTRYLNRVFDNTVATYKFYWLLSILELFVKHGKIKMSMWEISTHMVANAWYPINYFRLSFGKSDSLSNAILALRELKANELPINIKRSDLVAILGKMRGDSEVRKLLDFLKLNVPYRFLSPWFPKKTDLEVMELSQSFANSCLYKLEKKDGMLWVELNPQWLSYLQENYDILTSFAYWGLTNFLQMRNPNVPGIPNKLVKQEERNSLSAQHKFWDTAISQGMEVRCLYTDKLLDIKGYDLDHFIPWSFVSHDLLWNLMPADSSINSSKSNKLPDLDMYLPKLAVAHQTALKINLEVGKQDKLMEDYLSLGYTPQDIVMMDREHLLDCFKQTFSPMNQIALNMGFESWKYTI